MSNKLQNWLLSGTFILVSIAPSWAISVAAAPSSIAISKQSTAALSFCQAELRRRMGGNRSTISITASESIATATSLRLTGQGTYNRGDGSRLLPFNFSCVVNPQQNRVLSLSYAFTSRPL